MPAKVFKTDMGYYYYADAAEKTLTIDPDHTDENVVKFYYTKTSDTKEDRTNCYLIRYYVQDTDGKDKVVKEVTGTGKVGSEISVETDPIKAGLTSTGTGITFSQVTSDSASSETGGKPVVGDTTFTPTVVKVWYKRNQYSYTIRCRLYDTSATTTDLATPVTGTAYYESELTAEAKDIRGYTLVGPDTKTVTIAAQEGSSANEIVFYYTKNPNETGEYTITVNYMTKDADDVPGLTDEKITVTSTEPYTGTVTFPEVEGYTPKMLDSTNQWRDTASYTFDIEHVTDDITINVRYDSKRTTYTVNHYLPTPDGTSYSLYTSIKHDGFTGYTVGDVSLSLLGYYADTYDHPKIAYDGSTVVEIYYVRRSYTITLDLDGGTGIATTITAPCGTALSIGEPTRQGYTFEGWWLVEGENARASEMPDTMPAANVSFRASWKLKDGKAEASVQYYLEDAQGNYNLTDTLTIYADAGTKLTLDALKDGTEESGILACETPAHEHMLSCLQCTHTHTPYCYGLSDSATSTKSDKGFEFLFGDLGIEDGYIYNWTYDTSAPLTLSMTRHRYYYLYLEDSDGSGTFYEYPRVGYSSEEAAENYLSNQVGGMDMHTKKPDLSTEFDDFVLKFEGRAAKCLHNHTDECFICGYEEHEHDKNCCMDLTTRPGEYWTFDSETYEKTYGENEYASTAVKQDASTVVRLYFKRAQYTLTFEDSDGTTKTITAKVGANIKDYFDDEFFTGKTWMGEDYYADFGNNPVQSIDTMPGYNATFVRYTKDDTAVEKTVYYWVSDIGTKTDNKTLPTADDEGKFAGYSLYKTVTTYASSISYDTGYPELDGYYRYTQSRSGFGNVTNGGTYTFADGQTVLNLFYNRASYDLKFMADEGTPIKTVSVPYGASLAGYSTYEPTDPTATAGDTCKFEGWYTTPEYAEGTEFDFSEKTMTAGDLEIFAKFSRTHTVTAYRTEAEAKAGTDALYTQSGIEDGLSLTKYKDLKDPTYTGYTFDGWYYHDADGNEQVFNRFTDIKQSYTLYAHWTSSVSKKYTVRYVALVNGSEVQIADSTVGSAVAGKELTFAAKTGTELYEAYRDCIAEEESAIFMVTLDEEENTFEIVYTLKEEKVEYTTLTVAADADGAQEGQYFLYTVTANGVDTTVAVPANGSVTLSDLMVGGSCTITPQGDWSWRYAAPNAQTITLRGATTVRLTETKNNDFWLSGEAHN